MTELEIAINELQREKYNFLWNNCIIKSFRLKKMFPGTRVVICIGLWKWCPQVHAWCVIDGRRIETSHPVGTTSFMGVVSSDIVPIIGIWI